jgi:hypothetical protein
MLKSKFQLELPSGADSSIVHLPQLFAALQYHCGVLFREDKSYNFSNAEPFSNNDLVKVVPVVKMEIQYPGADHDLALLAAAYIKDQLYSDALSTLRLQISALMLTQGSRDMTDFMASRFRAELASLTYQIAVCQYLMKLYEPCCNTLRNLLESMPKCSAIAARMLTLLMCATFKSMGSSSSKVATALEYFEAGRAMYSITLGVHSPCHGLHVTALADLYFSVQALPHVKASLLVSQHCFNAALGDLHPVCANIMCKLGCLYLADNDYLAASPLFEAAFNVYRFINENSSTPHVYKFDEAHCLHGLAVALKGKGDTAYAMHCAISSIDIATSGGRPVTPGVVHTLLLLADLCEESSDLYTAISLYQDVWNVVRSSPQLYPMSKILRDVAGKLVRVIVDSLPLQSRTLLDSIIADCPRPTRSEWQLAISAICGELWVQEPAEYITETIKSALEEAGESGNLSSHS